jgi:hypothetical protein
LFTPVVGVSAGVCVAPDFGITVSFMVVDGIFGLKPSEKPDNFALPPT